MNILWVKAGGLLPLDSGGKIRSYNILKELARRHRITLYSYYTEHPDDDHPSLEGLFERVFCRPLRIAAPRSPLDFLKFATHFFSCYPHAMSRFYRPSVAKEVRALIQSEKYDVIVCDFLIPACVIPWELPYPKVLFTHNVEAEIYRRQYETVRNPIWKIAAWREYRVTLRTEHQYLKKADHVLAVSDADRDIFARTIDPAKITTIPTGVDVEYFQPETGVSQPDTLVFAGSMDWLPNEDAMLFFIREILPRIRRQVPDVSLLIVGRRPSQKLQSLTAADPGIQVTGRVADVRPYVRRGSVYVVPLRIGSGTRLKIFEAMAMGKAIVSTSIGAEGLPVQDGKNIRIADTVEEFADMVAGLLRNPAELEKLGRAARQLVERRYSWAAVARHFEVVLQCLTTGKAECPPPNIGDSNETSMRECRVTRV